MGKNNTAKRIRAWIASQKTPTDLIQKIQDKFENKVTVSWFPDGRAAIYPTWSGKRSAFDLFMIKTGSFTEAKIAPNEI